MYKKPLNFILTIILVLIFTINVGAQLDEEPIDDTNPPPEINRTVIAQRLETEAINWPIVEETRTESYDKETGVKHIHTTIIREQPVDENSTSLQCDARNTSISCVSGGDKYVEDTHTLSTSNGWIKSHAGHWQTKYCRSGDPYCQFRKPYKLQIWWTRSNQSWRTENAIVRWGCSNCNVCEGGTANYLHNDGPFTPQWSGNTSYYYTYTSSQWQKMDAWDWGSWNAGANSNAYYGWQLIGQLSTNADG